MVAVVQTAGDLANWHPHVHAILSHLAKAGARSPRGPPGVATLPTTS